MPDLSGFPALDVAIGLGFMFFLLSTVCSGINEVIANVRGWRAKTLEDAIRGVLDDDGAPSDPKALHKESGIPIDLTSRVLGHWRVTSLVRDPHSKLRRRNRPSYMPPEAFSLAVAETLAAAPVDGNEDVTPWRIADKQILAEAGASIDRLPEGSRPVLHKALTHAGGDLERFRRSLEHSYDDAMKRASGWYKRKVQVALAIIASVLVVGLDVDAVRVANRLWREPALRSAVAARASTAGQPATAAGGTTVAEAVSAAQRAAHDVSGVKELDLPIGWGSGNKPRDFQGLLDRIPGWLITIAALMLGAPFWFDVLSKVARVRGSGEAHPPVARTDAPPAADPAASVPPPPPAPPTGL